MHDRLPLGTFLMRRSGSDPNGFVLAVVFGQAMIGAGFTQRSLATGISQMQIARLATGLRLGENSECVSSHHVFNGVTVAATFRRSWT